MKFIPPFKHVEKILATFLHWLEKLKGILITIRVRPMYALGVAGTPARSPVYPSTAIVMQGPILAADNFTLESIRMYKKLHPNVSIVVSTWDDENPLHLDAIRQEGVDVIVNKKPTVVAPAKFLNINFQIISTAAGIREAAARGAEYVLKTRNDQRLYAPGLVRSLHDLMAYFPPENSQTTPMKKRLAALGSRSGGSKLYHVSDELLFGHIEDMMRYWNIDLVTENVEPFQSIEGYLFTTFLKNIGRRVSWTIEDSDEAYARYCVILDPLYADIYFHKYARHIEYRSARYKNIKHRSLFFLDWLRMYQDFKMKKSATFSDTLS